MRAPDTASMNTRRLGDLLRHYRAARGLSQQELARLVPPVLSHNTISNLERGHTRPFRHTLDALATALQLEPRQVAELLAAWHAYGAEAADARASILEPVPSVS